jgi:hypothetical protein
VSGVRSACSARFFGLANYHEQGLSEKETWTPATGRAPMVGLRMPPSERQAIEAWGAKHSPPLSFSKAFRQLAQNGLANNT